MLTEAALADLRGYVKRRIRAAQYKVGSVWYDLTISEIAITSDGVVRVKCPIAPGRACTVSGIRLISSAGAVWATKKFSVVIESAQVNLLQWFDFEITEVES